MMRHGQHNKRMRTRGGRGGRNGGGNPLSRSYESTGPDVKLRGTAAQIAEKYAQLARDAHSSGDLVLAENYLQYAEHYGRMIAAYQAQFAGQPGDGDEADDGFDGGALDAGWAGDEGPGRFRADSSPPRFERAEQPSVAFPQRDEAQPHSQPQGDSARGEPREGGRFNRRERFRPRYGQRDDAAETDSSGAAGPARERQNAPPGMPAAEADALPSFLTRPRRTRRHAAEGEETANNNAEITPASEA